MWKIVHNYKKNIYNIHEHAIYISHFCWSNRKQFKFEKITVGKKILYLQMKDNGKKNTE